MNPSPDAQTLLETDHIHLEAMLARAARSVREDQLLEAKARWEELEAALLAHLDAEEMFIVPQLTRFDPAEARAILREHNQIRKALGDIGIAFDLHTVRADAIEAFCNRLRAHAAHEQVVMYARVAVGLPVSTVRALVARLRARVTAHAHAHPLAG